MASNFSSLNDNLYSVKKNSAVDASESISASTIVYSNSNYHFYDEIVDLDETEVPTEMPVVIPSDVSDLPGERSKTNGWMTNIYETNHKYERGVDNSKRGDYDLGAVTYSMNNTYYMYKPESSDGCHQMAGACETDKYIIVTYKHRDDMMILQP